MRRLVVVAVLAACSKPAPVVAPAAEPPPATDARVEIVPETDGRTEVLLALNRLGKNLKVYYITNADLPPSSVVVLPGPDGHACKHPDGRFPVSDQWANDSGFGAAEFPSTSRACGATTGPATRRCRDGLSRRVTAIAMA